MARKSRTSRSATARDIAETEALLRELEGRLDDLSSAVAIDGRRVGGVIPDIIAATIAGLTARLGDKLRDGTRKVGDEAGRAGASAWRKLESEIGAGPLVTAAMAAGVGFLVGLLGRRSDR